LLATPYGTKEIWRWSNKGGGKKQKEAAKEKEERAEKKIGIEKFYNFIIFIHSSTTIYYLEKYDINTKILTRTSN